MKKKLLFRFYLLLTALLLTFYVLLPKPLFSIRENRRLANLSSGQISDLPKNISAFMRDRFPFRTFWIGIAAEASLLFGGEANGIFSCDGRLLKREDSFDIDKARRSCETVKAIAAYAGLPIYTVAIPRPSDVTGEQKNGYESPVKQEVGSFLAEIRSIGTDKLSIEDYYKTDHHLTVTGIEKLYRALCPSLGITEKMPQSYRAVSGFRGSVFRESGLFDFAKEDILLPIFGDESDIYFTAEEKELPFYRYDAVNTGDGYNAFLGGNYGYAVLSKGDTEKETLLVIKDSYANACVPYLLEDFRVVLVDPRYFRGNIDGLLQKEKPEKILLFAGVSLLLDGINLPLSE